MADESLLGYAIQMNRNILGVWLKIKAECLSCHSITETGMMSKLDHTRVWAWCEKCGKASNMKVTEIEETKKDAFD